MMSEFEVGLRVEKVVLRVLWIALNTPSAILSFLAIYVVLCIPAKDGKRSLRGAALLSTPFDKVPSILIT